ncbi:NUDIX domain-containing protein [Streptomyces sp. NPDC088253]|uniref:NUDIX domain-containing protein n=1 Tax=Streptomyces sp. NPDC088253 TaxID=3365846 RepID=UPI0037F5D392
MTGGAGSGRCGDRACPGGPAPARRLLLIRRTWPGTAPCRVFPGGHVEPDDPRPRAAPVRAIREETGAEPQLTGLAGVGRRAPAPVLLPARIRSWSEADRTGPEFTGPDRGEHRLEDVPLTVRALDARRLEPARRRASHGFSRGLAGSPLAAQEMDPQGRDGEKDEFRRRETGKASTPARPGAKAGRSGTGRHLTRRHLAVICSCARASATSVESANRCAPVAERGAPT